jgi:hypothetical protein
VRLQRQLLVNSDRAIVEDPSEAFQDLRDKIDFGVLAAQDAVLKLPLDREWVQETRKAMKLGEVSRNFPAF